MAVQLPDDMIVEILCRLPVKVVMRLKVVSKAWHRLISNVCAPLFSAAAAAHPSGFLFLCSFQIIGGLGYFAAYASYPDVHDCVGQTDGFVDSYACMLPFMLSSDHYFDCCNGLLLFVRREQREALPHYYFVCNTTTRQCVAIPNPRPRTAPFAAAIAYDPAKSPHYKVVRFIYLEEKTSCPVKLDIFSSDTGKWVRRGVMLSTELPLAAADADKYGCIRRSIYMDGMIYKLSFVVNYLIRFDLNAPSDVAIELPHKNAAACHGFIGMSRGSLYYSNHDESGLMISIWLLEDRCKRDPFWKLTHRISVDSLTSKYPDVRNSGFHFHTYAIHPASDIIFLGKPNMVLSYDLKSNKSEEVFTLSSGLEISSGQHFVHLYSPCYAVLSNFDNNCG
jgi:F-box interacting protein